MNYTKYSYRRKNYIRPEIVDKIQEITITVAGTTVFWITLDHTRTMSTLKNIIRWCSGPFFLQTPPLCNLGGNNDEKSFFAMNTTIGPFSTIKKIIRRSSNCFFVRQTRPLFNVSRSKWLLCCFYILRLKLQLCWQCETIHCCAARTVAVVVLLAIVVNVVIAEGGTTGGL